jgi:hypothetical protein
MEYKIFTLTVKVPSVGAPPIIRLRGVLKFLLRAHGITCISVEETAQHITAKPDPSRVFRRGCSPAAHRS